MPTGPWPELSALRDGPTVATLHLASQLVGKLAVALLPWRNHSWHSALHLHPRGLRTEPLYGAGGPFEAGLDLVEHAVTLTDAAGTRRVPLRPTTLAALHGEVMELLGDTRRDVRLHGAPNEIEPAVPFAEDQAERAYDRDSAERLLRALLQADRVLRLFRSGFLGKASPVHFFWGSFDLAVTRFSGRPGPRHPGGVPHLPDSVTREAYSHEVSSAGFWPGGAGPGGGPFFYSYAWPPPPGFAAARIEPRQARFDEGYGEFVLDYDVVRSAPDPDSTLLAFLDSTYAAAADHGNWDRAALECELGRPRVPRQV
jgi:hypothetical protein